MASGVPAARTSGVRFAFRALRHRGYALFWVAGLISNTGTWMQTLAVPFVLLQMTQSPFWVGMYLVARGSANFLAAPFGGMVADRFNLRVVLFITQAGMGAAALGLYVTWMIGTESPVLILSWVALSGAFQGFNQPAQQSLNQQLVPRDELPSAVTLNSLSFNAARTIGPASAGVVIATLGADWAFLLNALSFLGLLIVLPVMQLRPRTPSRTGSNVLRSLSEAGRYSMSQPGIRLGIVIFVIAGILGNPVIGLTAVFASDVWSAGPTGLGWINLAFGIGAVIGAPLLTGWEQVLTRSRLTRIGMPLYGVMIAAFALAPNLGLGCVAFFLCGLAFLGVNIVANTSIQIIVADHIRGRVLALRYMLFTASLPIGSFIQGTLAEHIGVVPTVALAGATMLACGVAFNLLRGSWSLAHLDDPHDESPAPA